MTFLVDCNKKHYLCTQFKKNSVKIYNPTKQSINTV